MKLSFDSKYFKQYIRDSNHVHKSVPVTYQAFKIDGKKYFQIDCYSKNIDIDKIGPSKQSSHKLQFDKENAIKFISLLKKELDIL